MEQRKGPLEDLGLDLNFWKNKKVFITGHTGFKGSWLCLYLNLLGSDVYGYSLEPPSNPNLFDVANIKSIISSVIGDVRDIDFLDKTIKKIKPDIVIHMAAQSLVRYSYSYPVDTYSTNVMGLVNILQVARNYENIKSIIVVTSDKCYENREWIWAYRENENLGGVDPYSNSKACAELVTSSYRSSFFKNTNTLIASVRAGNVIGGGDWSLDRLIPDFFRSLNQNKLMSIRNPNAIRPWQYVLEPLTGYLLLAKKLYEGEASFAEPWNFGPNSNNEKNVLFLIDFLKNYYPNFKFKIEEQAEELHEAGYLKLDSTKAKEVLKWKSLYMLEDILLKICKWNDAYAHGESMSDYCINEINDYMMQLKNE